MKYSYRDGVEKQKSRKWVILPVAGLLGGAYILVNIFSPMILSALQPSNTTAKKLITLKPELDDDRIYVPKLNVDVPVISTDGNETTALERGAVQRALDSGNPKQGGNYVVAAPRFNLGLTPLQTNANSPLYNIAKLSTGDDIYVDFGGERYAYKVEERKTVPPAAVEIEERTDDNRLTLYTSDPTDREVVIAKPVGKIVWTDGKPKLKSL